MTSSLAPKEPERAPEKGAKRARAREDEATSAREAREEKDEARERARGGAAFERTRERDVGLAPWAERRARAVIEAVFARSGARDAAGDPANKRPAELAPPPSERVSWVCREIDDFLARVTLRTHLVVTLSLFAVTTVAPWLVGKLGGFAALPLAERVEALERFEKSSLSPALLAVKALLSVHYYEHPDAAREVGFDGC